MCPNPRSGACADARAPDARVSGARAGVTLVEALLSAVLLAAVLGGISSAFVASSRLGALDAETARAHDAARARVERMQGTPFELVFATYNGDPGDDPGGPGTAPGKDFAVPGLPARPGDPDGYVGELVFPTVDAEPGRLREDVRDPALGMPRDLDGDGAWDALDHARDYVVLPVTVRLAWRGVAGDRVFEMQTVLVP